jgi:[protein-PII] uridylyltransferase
MINSGTEIQAGRSSRVSQEKTLAHAATRFAALEHLSDPSEIAQRLRAFLKLEEQRLRMAHRGGASGRATTQARSFVLDTIVQRAFRAAAWPGNGGEFLGSVKNICAVVALGGYGRCELAPYSDLDLLFLHTGRRAAQMRQLTERVLRLLWDAGLTIGHSFRTVKECLAAARTDTHLQTALVHTRLLAGNGALYDCLAATLTQARRKASAAAIAAVRAAQGERYSKFGADVCLQEPNVKEGAGGLRDLHMALWVGYAKTGGTSLADLCAHNLISTHEQKVAERAYEFLLRVRYGAHLLAGRKMERIALDLQPALAAEFGYTSTEHLLASEKFMRDYYRRARELHLFSATVLARATAPEKRPARWFSLPSHTGPVAEPFSIKEGLLELEDAQLFTHSPLALFDAFALGQAARVPFSHNLAEATRRSLVQVNRAFRTSEATAGAFLNLLRRRGRVGHALRLMHEVGFLGRYLPEFARISLLIQHDLYHHYTIDEHTLKVVEALDELNNSKDRRRAQLRAVFDEVADVALLYLALLLHDIGKGHEGGHVARGVQLAARICQRLQLDARAAAQVVLLVKHHLTMAHISQRRDLTEPRVAADFAAQVGTLDNLNMLLLLSYADMNGVGPGVWSEWKGSLLWELYERTRTQLAGGAVAVNGPAELAQLKEKIVTALQGEFPPSEVERHLALLPERYAHNVRPETAATHLLLTKQLAADVCAVRWTERGRAGTELTICAHDRHGLFADIAGTLTAQGIEILSAEINTREDGIALDIFMLREAATRHAVEERKRLTIERALRASVRGENDVAARVEKWRTAHAPRRRPTAQHTRTRNLPRVVCANEAAQFATVVEVCAADEPGLAYKIAHAITVLEIEIVYAKLTTEKSDAFDVFYVTDNAGRRLTEAAARALETALTAKLAATNRPATAPPQPNAKEISR